MAAEAPNPTATIAALVVLLLSRGPIAQLVRLVQNLLVPFGIHPEAARAATELVAPNVHGLHEPGTVSPTSALHAIVRTGVPRQAAYLFDAASRISAEIHPAAEGPPLTPAPPELVGAGALPPESRRAAFGQASSERIRSAVRDPELQAPVDTQVLDRALAKERRYFDQHLGAERGRREAAARVDLVAKRLGTMTLGWYGIKDGRTDGGCLAAIGHNFDATRPPSIGYPGAVHPSCRCRPGPPHAGQPLVDELVLPTH
jgi:hypothetical protein